MMMYINDTQFIADFAFVNQQIDKTMKDTCQSITSLFTDITPELDAKIKELSKIAAEEIKVSCREGIEEVNKVIDEHLSIQNNVLLEAHKEHELKTTRADQDALAEECEQLEQAVKEVRRRSCICTN